MRITVDQGSPSGAPIAVPQASADQVALSRIDGYDQLKEEDFRRLLDEIGPPGLGTTVVTLLSASTAASFLLGWLAYGVPLFTLVSALVVLSGVTYGTARLDRRRRRRLVAGAAVDLGFTERFANRIARDLELMKGWLPPEERPAAFSSWPTEKEALVKALRHVREP